MSNLLLARWQLGLTLVFHIVFAALGVGLPLFICFAEYLGRRRNDDDYLKLAKAWSKVAAVLFAIGAASGTVVSFELGLLFPGFMREMGQVIGLPFAIEGFAFFAEAIFFGVYLYGWSKVSHKIHLLSGLIVAVGGLSSAFLIITVNAWMNVPVGVTFTAGHVTAFDPWRAMRSPFVLHEFLHMAVAAYMATGFTVAGVHAWSLLKRGKKELNLKAIWLGLVLAVPFSLIQPGIGHFSGEMVAKYQPLKLAAMERQYRTGIHAPLKLGGVPDDELMLTRYAIEIPSGLSMMATDRADGKVIGLEEFPKADWPHPVVHYSFQLMVALGGALMALSLWILWDRFRKKKFSPGFWLMRSIILGGPLAFLALETGWIVTEVGRQPWVVNGVVRTSQAVTPVGHLLFPLVAISTVFALLGIATVVIAWRQLKVLVGYEHGKERRVGGQYEPI
jgi:cytochrome d ubiquinol oxidase subunit I